MRKFWKSASAIVLLTTAVVAQEPVQEPTFRAQSNVVTVPALVRDARGKVVYGLTAGDFIIEDDGIEQTVQMEESAESRPISLVVALQRGRRASREFSRMRGLGAMLNPIFDQPESQVALVEFDSGVTLAQDFTNDSAQIRGALEHVEAGDSGAAILDAVQYSMRLLSRSPRGTRRVLLLISETRDHGSHFAKMADVVAAVGSSDVVTYALPFSPAMSQFLDTERGSNQDEWGNSPNLLAPLVMASQAMRRNTAKAIAEQTGGEYEMFNSRKGFERLMTDFANHVHSRYQLSFEPRNPHPGLHEIRVRLRTAQKETILARTSYWAEESTR
jgi:VWFA-related protein